MKGIIGSGIELVGYADRVAGVVYCRPCGDDGDGVHMERVYSPDVNEDTPDCYSCGEKLDGDAPGDRRMAAWERYYRSASR